MSNLALIQNNIERLISRRISDDFEKIAKDLIKFFYSSYSPSRYKRTYNYEESVNISKVKGKHTGGIRISANLAAHKEASGEDVFDLIWNQGIRGLPATGEDGWVNPYFMTTNYYIPEFGLSGQSPDKILTELCDVWFDKREVFIDTIVMSELDKILLF